MPLYEYECDVCRRRFEILQKLSEPAVETCPSCGKTVHKLQSAPAIQFKGAGFYITDYAKKEYTAATKADSGDAAAGNKEGGQAGSKDKTEKGVTPEKISATSDSAPSSSGPASTTSTDPKG